MKNKKGNLIKGNWSAMMLPFKKDQSIDYDLLASEIDYLITSKVDGIYSNGTAGEFYNITEDEFDKTSKLLAEKCTNAHMPFQIGISHMSPIISLERLRRVKLLKPLAFQVIMPDWFPLEKSEMLVFLKKIEQEADGIGLVLYNPPQSKTKLSPKDFGWLKKEISGLVGIKVAGGNDEWYVEMRKHCKNLSVFIPGHFLASGLKNGAQGSYSNMACLSPTAAQKWYDLALRDIEKALELEKRINIFMSQEINPLITDKKYANMAIDKFLCYLGRWAKFSPQMRWPYNSVDISLAGPIMEKGKKLIPEFFE